MDLDEIVANFMIYLKNQTESKYYNFFHGSYEQRDKLLKVYMSKHLKLSYTEYLKLKTDFEELRDYLELYMDVPKKKKPERRVPESQPKDI
jgi:hypothetical protein